MSWSSGPRYHGFLQILGEGPNSWHGKVSAEIRGHVSRTLLIQSPNWVNYMKGSVLQSEPQYGERHSRTISICLASSSGRAETRIGWTLEAATMDKPRGESARDII